MKRLTKGLTDSKPGGGLFGFDISSMSGVLGTQAYVNYFRVGSGQYKQASFHLALYLESPLLN
jgi:hypothetical protein